MKPGPFKAMSGLVGGGGKAPIFGQHLAKSTVSSQELMGGSSTGCRASAEDLCGVNANHLSGNSNRTLSRSGTGGRLGTARRRDRLGTSRRTVGVESLRRTASGRVPASRRTVGSTNTRVGPANTRFGITSARGGANTRIGIANTRVGTANTRAGQANTRVGIANARGRGRSGTSANGMDNARVILTPVQQGAVRSMRNLLQNGRSTTGRGANPRLIGFLIPRPDGRTQLQLMPDARRFLGGSGSRRFNGRVRAQMQRNSTLPLNLRTIINAARRANLLPGSQTTRGPRNPAVGREQSIVVLRPRDGEAGGLLQAPDNLRSNSVRNQILEERRNAFRVDNRNLVDRVDRFTTTRPLDRTTGTRSRQNIGSQSTRDQTNRRIGVDQSRPSRRTIAVARERAPLSSGVDRFTNPGPDPNQFLPNNSPEPIPNNAFAETATPPLQDRTLFLPSSVNNNNGLDQPVTQPPLTINTDPFEKVFPPSINGEIQAPQSPTQNTAGITSTVFQAASGTQPLPQTLDSNANIQTVDSILTDSQNANARFEPSVTGTSTNMQTNLQTDMPPIQPQSSTSVQTGFDIQANRQTIMEPAFTPEPIFNTPTRTQTDITQTQSQTSSVQESMFDPSTISNNDNMMQSGMTRTSTSVFDLPSSMQTATTLAQTPSPGQIAVDNSVGLQTNNILPTDNAMRPIVDSTTSTQIGMSQTQPSQLSGETSTGLFPNQAQGTTIDASPQPVQLQNNVMLTQDTGNMVDSTMSLPPPILPVSSVSTNLNSQVGLSTTGQVDQSTMFNSLSKVSDASITNNNTLNLSTVQQTNNIASSQFNQNQFANARNSQLALDRQADIQSQPSNAGPLNPLTSTVNRGGAQTQTDTLTLIQNNANLGQFTSAVKNMAMDRMQRRQFVNIPADTPVDTAVGQNGNIKQVNIQNPGLDQNLIQGPSMVPLTNDIQFGTVNQNAIEGTNTMLMNTQGAPVTSNINQNIDQRNLLDTGVVQNEIGQIKQQSIIQGQSNVRNPNLITIEITGQSKQQGDVTGITGQQSPNLANTQNIEYNTLQNNNLQTGTQVSQTFMSASGESRNIQSNSASNQIQVKPIIQSNVVSGVSSNIDNSLSAVGMGRQTNTVLNSSNNFAGDVMTANTVQDSITSNILSEQLTTDKSTQKAIEDLTSSLNQALLASASTTQNNLQDLNSQINGTSSPTYTRNVNVGMNLVTANTSSNSLFAEGGVNIAANDPKRIELINPSSINPPPPLIVPQNTGTQSINIIKNSNIAGEINLANRTNNIPSQVQTPNVVTVETQNKLDTSANNASSIQNNVPAVPQAPNIPMDLPNLKTTSDVLNLNAVSVVNSTTSGKGSLFTNTINAEPPVKPSQSQANGVKSPEQVTGLPVTSSLPDIMVASGKASDIQVRQKATNTETAKLGIEQAATAFKTASNITDVAMPTATIKALIQTSLNTSGIIRNLNQIDNSSSNTEVLSAASGLVEGALSRSDATLGKTNTAPNRPQNVVMDISTLKTLISEVLSEFFSHQFNPAKTALTPTAVINTVAQAVVDAQKYASPTASNSASGAGQEPVQAIFTTSPQVPAYPKDSKIDFPPPPPFAGMTESINIPKTEVVDIRPSNAMENAFLSRSANTGPINPILIGEPNLKSSNSSRDSNIKNVSSMKISQNAASPILPINTRTSNIEKIKSGPGSNKLSEKSNGIVNDQNIFSSTIIKTPNIDSLRVITESNVAFNQNPSQGFQQSGIIRQPPVRSIGVNTVAGGGGLSDINMRRSGVTINREEPIPSLTTLNNQKNLLTASDGTPNQNNPQIDIGGLTSSADFQVTTPSLRSAEFDAMRNEFVRSEINAAAKVLPSDSNFLANIPDSLLSTFNNDFTSLSPLLGVTKSTPTIPFNGRDSGINTQSVTSKVRSLSTQSDFQGTTNLFEGSKMTTPFSGSSTRRPLMTTSNDLPAEKPGAFRGQRTSTSPLIEAGGVSVAPSTQNMPLFRSTFSGTTFTRKPLFSTTRTRSQLLSSGTTPRMLDSMTGVTRNVRTASVSSKPLSTNTVTQRSTSTQSAPSFGFDPSKSFGLLGLPPPPPSNLMEMNATSALIADTAISSSQLSLMSLGSSTSIRTNRPLLSTVPPSVTVDPLVRSSTIHHSSPAVTSSVNLNTPLV
ncbi:mucin-5AC-like [Ylistrum balloti]|uniref:mucin-5AC-like n=1 Tax=Ylistrum balloti TaxID=509963 RepID=UPI002905B8FD|nr:mucin-5AC-like [Ylistrum balloti]